MFVVHLLLPTLPNESLGLATLAESNSPAKTNVRLSLPAPGVSSLRELAPGETHSYQIEMNAGDYLHVSVQPNEIDIIATIRNSAGQLSSQSYCRSYDTVSVSVIAERSEVFSLELQLRENETGRGGYKVKVIEIRPATPKDNFRISAERASAEAEQLLNAWRSEDSRNAIEKLKESLASWRQAGDSNEEAQVLQRLGNVSQALGEYANALDYYGQALLINRKEQDRAREAESLTAICSVHISMGKNQKGLELCSRALNLVRGGNPHEEAQVLNNLGEVAYGFGNLQSSIEYYRQALPLWRELHDRQGQALTLLNFGYTYSDLGEMREALDFFDQAYSLWASVDNRRGEALTLSALGRLQSRLGESQKALNSFEKALQLIERLGDPIWKAATLTGMAYIYQGLGDNELALKNYNEALVLFRAGKNVPGEANTLYDIAGVYYSSKDYEKALENYQNCLSISKTGADRRAQSYALRGIGRVYDALGEHAKALEKYLVAQSFYRDEKDLRGEADVLNLLGRIYVRLERKSKAHNSYQNALALNRKANYKVGEATTLYNIATLARSEGKIDECRAQIEAALQVVESLRSNVDSEELRSTYLASVHQDYEYYIDVLMELHKQRPSDGYDSSAFDASERARARSLLELLGKTLNDRFDKGDASLLELERANQKLIQEKIDQKRRVAEKSPGDADVLTKEIDQLAAENRELRMKIDSRAARDPDVEQPRPLSLRTIQQQVLDDDSLLLEYALTDERSYLWAVTREQVKSYELPGRAVIEEAARSVYALLIANQPLQGETFEQRQTRVARADEQLPSQIANLSKILLGPVSGELGTKRLLIVPDGALQYIPFQILNTGNDQRPLVVDHEIVNEPSASALALLVTETKSRKSARNTVAVLADPVFESDDPRITSGARPGSGSTTGQGKEIEFHQALRDVNLSGDGHIPRLLASRAEANAIMAVTPWRSGFEAMDFEASRATVTKTDLSDYRIVHFATHGLLNNEHPELSGIVLSLFDQKGQPQDGYLRLHDIYNLKLPVDLVVLSACNTGLGKDVRGEGLIGLTRGFMYAGASSVVASLWKVDDEATSELMRLFYGYMLRDGLSPAAALRKAQVIMSQQKRWQSPYYWAGFVIQGQYIPSERVNRFSSQRVVLSIVVAVILSTAAFYALRRRRRISL